jgi:hypothetical protein
VVAPGEPRTVPAARESYCASRSGLVAMVQVLARDAPGFIDGRRLWLEHHLAVDEQIARLARLH